MKKMYLAGPFFNSAQVELMATIEGAVAAAGFKAFSPRLHARQLGKGATPEQQRDTFDDDLVGLQEAGVVLAVLDWKLPDTERVLKEYWTNREGKLAWRSSEDTILNIPDSGTVWEMGYAFSRNIPVVGFTENPRAVNLMLMQSCLGVVVGLKKLEEMLLTARNARRDILDPPDPTDFVNCTRVWCAWKGPTT